MTLFGQHEDVSSSGIYRVVREFNPWWGDAKREVPTWRRAAFRDLMNWLVEPVAARAVLLSGARRTGKTTLLLQAAWALIDRGIDPRRVIYLTLDHPVLRLVGLRRIQEALSEWMPSMIDPFILVDEVQNDSGWIEWVKHRVDFQPRTRIAMTGSAMTLSSASTETGTGRWHTIRLPTLSFCEYLRLREEPEPTIKSIRSLAEVFNWNDFERIQASMAAEALVPRFHQYLLRGGFPQTARVESVRHAQQLLREEIVDGALRRDITTFYEVRNPRVLERLFLYLCMHDGGILNLSSLASLLEVGKQTVLSYLTLLENVHLIYLLQPSGYGKQVLRGQYKAYIADPAIASAVLLHGDALLTDPARLGAAVESAVFKHLFTHYYAKMLRFAYWRAPRTGKEVDMIAESGDLTIPFEVKYRSDRGKNTEIDGLIEYCRSRRVERGYVLTRELTDFSVSDVVTDHGTTKILRIPAMLACYLLSRRELESGSV